MCPSQGLTENVLGSWGGAPPAPLALHPLTWSVSTHDRSQKTQTFVEGHQLAGAGISEEIVMRLLLQMLEKLKTESSCCYQDEEGLLGR